MLGYPVDTTARRHICAQHLTGADRVFFEVQQRIVTQYRPISRPAVPDRPIYVVTSVDQWGDIVSTLGGNCAKATTVLVSWSVNPHDYEPRRRTPSSSPTHSSSSSMARVTTCGPRSWRLPPFVTLPSFCAAAATKTPDGANPHLWYNPWRSPRRRRSNRRAGQVVFLGGHLFRRQRFAFCADLKPYTDLIAKIKAEASGKSYAATESVFDYMAAASAWSTKPPETTSQPSRGPIHPRLIFRRSSALTVRSMC